MSYWDEIFKTFAILGPSWSAQHKCLEPLVEIEDGEEDILVSVDLPCVASRDDIKLQVAEDSLALEAAFRRGMRWERWGTVQRQVEFRSFKKMIRLPARINPEQARAIFRQGVLQISMPKQKRRFTIRVD